MDSKNNINKKEILAKIIPVIEKAANEICLVPIEINFVQDSGRWYLRIFIYKHDEPISHIDCENLTKNLSEHLDDLIPVQYYLEVSSPGIERKLKSVEEYNIFKGKKVNIKLKQPIQEFKNFAATIIKYSSESGLEVQIADNGKIINIKKENISSVKLHLD